MFSQMERADIIFINGKIWTVDDSNPVAEAVAVRDDKIIFVGSNSDVKKFADAKTKIIDLKGRLMLPGFIDDHTHFISGGFQLASVDLRDAKTPEEFIKGIIRKDREVFSVVNVRELFEFVFQKEET